MQPNQFDLATANQLCMRGSRSRLDRARQTSRRCSTDRLHQHHIVAQSRLDVDATPLKARDNVTDDFPTSLRFLREQRPDIYNHMSSETKELLRDIEYRIKRSRRLSLMELGYRGDALIEMHEMLFGVKPRSTKPRAEPVVASASMAPQPTLQQVPARLTKLLKTAE
jgi:hypothetical protein